MLKSKKNPIYFIAEVGSNHEGNFKEAIRIVKNCIKSKADCVKIQIFNPQNLVSKKYDFERYNHFNKLQLSVDEYFKIAEICKKSDKDFSASIWDKNLIHPFKKYVKFYKVGSGDLTNYEIIYEIIKTKKPIVLSVGLSNFNEIRKVLNFIKNIDISYTRKNKISLLHCNTSYPTPLKDSRLFFINHLKRIFKVQVGYSDHTVGIKTILNSYNFGAKIIEKHYSLNPKKKSFRDHLISCTNQNINDFFSEIKFKNLKISKNIKAKSFKKTISKSEKRQNNLYSFRRSLYLSRDIKKGEKLNSFNLISLRPQEGICASKYFLFKGKKISKNLTSGTLLNKSHILK